MDADRFDTVARLLAGRFSRRRILGRAGAGGVVAAVGAVGGAAGLGRGPGGGARGRLLGRPGGAVLVGPNEGRRYRGTLTFRIDDGGAIDDADWETDDGDRFDAVGQATGRALNLRIELDDGAVLTLTGTGERDLLLCRGAIAGLFSGPEAGDLGSWTTVDEDEEDETTTTTTRTTTTRTKWIVRQLRRLRRRRSGGGWRVLGGSASGSAVARRRRFRRQAEWPARRSGLRRCLLRGFGSRPRRRQRRAQCTQAARAGCAAEIAAVLRPDHECRCHNDEGLPFRARPRDDPDGPAGPCDPNGALLDEQNPSASGSVASTTPPVGLFRSDRPGGPPPPVAAAAASPSAAGRGSPTATARAWTSATTWSTAANAATPASSPRFAGTASVLEPDARRNLGVVGWLRRPSLSGTG